LEKFFCEGEKMKKFLIILLICLSVGHVACATVTYITSDATIKDGDVYNGVVIQDSPPNHTTVNMTGGTVYEGLDVLDSATFNFSGGQAGIGAFDRSTVNITGGIASVGVGGNATANIFNNANVAMATAGGLGTLNVYGGTIGLLSADESSGPPVINIYGGTITDYILVYLPATVNVFGYDLAKTSTGGTYGAGQVTGFWLDGSPFTINLGYSDVYSAINLIPEPSTLLLLGAGAFLLRKPR
jgi:hypothetical protein